MASRGSSTASVCDMRRAPSASGSPLAAAAARIAIPNADSLCAGRRTARPSASARSWLQRALRVAPPVRLTSPPTGAPSRCERLEAEPLDERHALHERGGVLAVAGGRAEHERLRVGRGEREALAARDERIGEHAGALVAGGGAAEHVEVLVREGGEQHAGAAARRAAGQPAAARRAVRVDAVRAVLDAVRGAALEDERRAEHGVDVTGTQRARGDLRRAAVGHAGDDRRAGGQPGLPRGLRADDAELRAGRDDRGQQAGHVVRRLRPAFLARVVAGLQRVAGVRRDGVPGEPARDDVGLVGEPQAVARGVAAAPPAASAASAAPTTPAGRGGARARRRACRRT